MTRKPVLANQAAEEAMTPTIAEWATESNSVQVATQHELLLQAWECAFAGTSMVYLSGPITGGPRFVDWYRSSGRQLLHDKSVYSAEQKALVIAPNSRSLKGTAAQLRVRFHEPVLEPSSLYVSGWTQNEYLMLWSRVVEKFASRVIAMAGWEYSAGSATELYRAYEHNLPVTSVDGTPLELSHAIYSLRRAAKDIAVDAVPVPGLSKIADALTELDNSRKHPIVIKSDEAEVRKDKSLDRLADRINVAQFVSFSPSQYGLHQEYSRVLGLEPNAKFENLKHAIGVLLERSSEKSINLRSYSPDSPQSREFLYGIQAVDEAISAAERLGSEGLFVIANETIDVHDGGVSGVLMSDVIEFSPDDTPRCVEKPGIASLPCAWGINMLSTVYGFAPDLDVARASRLEFSLHPKPRGWRHTHTLGWEYAPAELTGLEPKLSWPNNFSGLIGDKVYGLLIAHLVGLPVPYTTVFNRRVAPFSFGRPTGSFETWLRTSPREQVPGKFTTTKGWIDPFRLLQAEDPDENHIASVLSQQAIPAKYAGAAIVTADNHLIIEGVAGEGDSFMQGMRHPEKLPENVLSDVEALHRRASAILGPTRFEWVFDGNSVWVVQLHRGATQSTNTVLVPGDAKRWELFDVAQGLDQLRYKISSLDPSVGLLLQGEVGLTSHVADVLRRSGVPARLK